MEMEMPRETPDINGDGDRGDGYWYGGCGIGCG
jgi:hypothetical protein